ncbi:hypothetical protein H800_YJM1342F00075 [Saccharomyces cerevisiae YJM1342]|nr:hypothetical protein H800_YJM1342F00075 [Saccharomyces cerevisiae YJM1342]
MLPRKYKPAYKKQPHRAKSNPQPAYTFQ